MGLYTTDTPEATEALGRELAGTLHAGDVVAFTGELGAGKTTFCRGLAAGLGCSDPVSSPTFAIVNYYRGPLPLAHFDAWRIAGEEDLEAAGFYDYLASGAVVAIEWSENIAPLLPDTAIRINMQALSTTRRQISIEGVQEL